MISVFPYQQGNAIVHCEINSGRHLSHVHATNLTDLLKKLEKSKFGCALFLVKMQNCLPIAFWELESDATELLGILEHVPEIVSANSKWVLAQIGSKSHLFHEDSLQSIFHDNLLDYIFYADGNCYSLYGSAYD